MDKKECFKWWVSTIQLGWWWHINPGSKINLPGPSHLEVPCLLVILHQVVLVQHQCRSVHQIQPALVQKRVAFQVVVWYPVQGWGTKHSDVEVRVTHPVAGILWQPRKKLGKWQQSGQTSAFRQSLFWAGFFPSLPVTNRMRSKELTHPWGGAFDAYSHVHSSSIFHFAEKHKHLKTATGTTAYLTKRHRGGK